MRSANECLHSASRLFGIGKIPSQNHIRDLPGRATSDWLHQVFAGTIEQLRRTGGGLEGFHRLDGCMLSAPNGTEYHCSKQIHCAQGSTRLRSQSGTQYCHGMLAATLVAPGQDKVIALAPEFIVLQDGAEKQGRENGTLSSSANYHRIR